MSFDLRRMQEHLDHCALRLRWTLLTVGVGVEIVSICGVMLNRSLHNLNPNLQATTKVKPQTHSKSSLNPWSLEMIRSRCYIHDLLLLLLLFQPGTVDSGQLLRAPCPATDSQHLCILVAICQGRGRVGRQQVHNSCTCKPICAILFDLMLACTIVL